MRKFPRSETGPFLEPVPATETRRGSGGVFRSVRDAATERRSPSCNHRSIECFEAGRCRVCGRTKNEIALDEGSDEPARRRRGRRDPGMLFALLFVLGLGSAACTSHVTTFVRDVAIDTDGALLVTRCTLDEDGFTKSSEVDHASCHVDRKVRP